MNSAVILKDTVSLKANIRHRDMATNSTMTSELGSVMQPQKKLSFMCHLWFSLLFLICFSSQSVLSIPLDRTQMMMTGENPSETGDQNSNQGGELSRLYLQLYSSPAYQHQFLFQPNSGSFKSSASQPDRKMAHQSFNPTDSFLDHIDFERERRNSGPSLSIVNPLDVLRQRLLIEIGRRRLHSQNSQINANTEFLKTIGKRRRR